MKSDKKCFNANLRKRNKDEVSCEWKANIQIKDLLRLYLWRHLDQPILVHQKRIRIYAIAALTH